MRNIYGVKISTAFRTLWMADELGLDFEQVALDFKKKRAQNP